jgi:hypothetical protein
VKHGLKEVITLKPHSVDSVGEKGALNGDNPNWSCDLYVRDFVLLGYITKSLVHSSQTSEAMLCVGLQGSSWISRTLKMAQQS